MASTYAQSQQKPQSHTHTWDEWRQNHQEQIGQILIVKTVCQHSAHLRPAYSAKYPKQTTHYLAQDRSAHLTHTTSSQLSTNKTPTQLSPVAKQSTTKTSVTKETADLLAPSKSPTTKFRQVL